jgi:hypothetical protein
MTDKEIEAVFDQGNTKSRMDGLRAVYEAGRGHDARDRVLAEAATLAAVVKPAKKTAVKPVKKSKGRRW